MKGGEEGKGKGVRGGETVDSGSEALVIILLGGFMDLLCSL